MFPSICLAIGGVTLVAADVAQSSYMRQPQSLTPEISVSATNMRAKRLISPVTVMMMLCYFFRTMPAGLSAQGGDYLEHDRYLAMEPSSSATGPFEVYRARVILGIVVTFTVTSTVSLVLRFVGKWMNRTKMLSEDFFAIAAQVVVYGLAAVCILEVVLGNAGHNASEDPSKVPNALKILVPVICLYVVSLSLVKISICLFYNRIFPFRKFQVASWITISLVLGWSVGSVIYTFMQCRPFAYFWNPDGPGGKCIANKVIPYVIIGATDVLIDIIIFILPLPMLWKLQVSQADKVALSFIFGAGLSTMAIAILRTEALVNVSFPDVTYTGAYALAYSFAEPAIGISVACAPLFRPLFRRAFRNRDIELSTGSKFRRMRSHSPDSSPLPTLPSFVDANVHSGRGVGYGRQELFITTQVLESGNWSQTSHSRTSFVG